MKGLTITIIAVAVVVITVIVLTRAEQIQKENDMMQLPTDSKITVLASFYPLYEFAKNIGGDRAEVSSFVPLGIEPHDWEPSAGDILRLKNADIFIYIGAGFESYVDKFANSNEYDNVAFIEMMKNIELIRMHDDIDDEHELEYDPHIWLDPILAKQQVMIIKNSMIEVDPKNANYYEANADVYMKKLDELDMKIRNELSNCQKDTFMPFHNAFSYFAERYNLKVSPLSGISPESEATATELKRFIDFIKEHDIKVIFSEDLIDPRLAQTLADEAGVQTMVLSPIEGLSDSDLNSEATYISKMEDNLQNLKFALECQ